MLVVISGMIRSEDFITHIVYDHYKLLTEVLRIRIFLFAFMAAFAGFSALMSDEDFFVLGDIRPSFNKNVRIIPCWWNRLVL